MPTLTIDEKRSAMYEELLALRGDVYETAAAYHAAGATYMRARLAEGLTEAVRQACEAFIAAGAPYDAALAALQQNLVTAPPGVAPPDELAHVQRLRELLRDEVAHLEAAGRG
jgi:hypothetical protein